MMMENNDQYPYHNFFYPIRVGIPKDSTDTHVWFSIFSLPKGSPVFPTKFKRGIANIEFETQNPDIEVILQVPILIDEVNLKLYALKDRGWEDLGATPKGDKRGIWGGYLEAIIKAGDPPIALGE